MIKGYTNLRIELSPPRMLMTNAEGMNLQIDELDLHLHPKWQKTIVDDLKRTFPKSQFIITTHSPFIIQSICADELFDIETMSYTVEEGNYNGWSIEVIQEKIMGVELRTTNYNKLIRDFSDAIDSEEYKIAENSYQKLVRMMTPGSSELKIIEMDMVKADDKAD